MAGNIQIMIVDDHAIVREGIKSLLELQEEIEIVDESKTGIECLEKIDEIYPDVILMDLKMPGIGGIEATRVIKGKYPGIKILLLTNYDDEEYVIEAIKAGADGYVLKDVKKGDLPAIIKGALKDRAFIDPNVTHKLFHRIKETPGDENPLPVRPVLTRRELQILTQLVEGGSNKEIADAICLSTDTVKTHLKNIYQKLGVHNRSQAVKTAVQSGIVFLNR